MAIYLSSPASKDSDALKWHVVVLDVRSSNAVVRVTYTDTTLNGTASNRAGLGDQVALARDILTVLSHPAAATGSVTRPLSGPHFGIPAHACRLVTAATLRHFLPGGAADPDLSDIPIGEMSSCEWDTPSYDWWAIMYLDVHSDIFDTGMLGPQAGYEVDVQQADVSGNGTTVLGAQPVTGLDGQATAIYTASPGTHSQGITLVAWSGNAVMQFTYEPVAPALGGPPPSRSAELAIVTGIARAVFAALPHSAAS
jgi:hypothetical protein